MLSSNNLVGPVAEIERPEGTAVIIWWARDKTVGSSGFAWIATDWVTSRGLVFWFEFFEPIPECTVGPL